MNLADKIQRILVNCSAKKTTIKATKGWLWIEDYGDHWNLGLSTGKDGHDLRMGPYYSVDISKGSGLIYRQHGMAGAWKRALSTWAIRIPTQAQEIYETSKAAVEEIHHRLYTVPSLAYKKSRLKDYANWGSE